LRLPLPFGTDGPIATALRNPTGQEADGEGEGTYEAACSQASSAGGPPSRPGPGVVLRRPAHPPPPLPAARPRDSPPPPPPAPRRGAAPSRAAPAGPPARPPGVSPPVGSRGPPLVEARGGPEPPVLPIALPTALRLAQTNTREIAQVRGGVPLARARLQKARV